MNMHFLNRVLEPLKITVNKNQTVVAVDEEFGYKRYIWISDFSNRELEQWWRRQHNIGKFYFNPPSIKHGVFIKDKSYDYQFGNEFWDFNMCNSVVWNIWNNLWDHNLTYRCHIFDDECSFLRTPRGRFINHMGYWPSRLQTERDVREYISDV